MFTMNNKKQQPEVFYKNPAFNGKHLRWSVFLIKFQVFRPATVLQTDFFYEYREIFKNAYF